MFSSLSKRNRYRQRNFNHGFTLIEMMVSLTVFSVVMLISVGTLLIMIDVNAKAQALYSSTTNLSFALDSMTRELRTGYHYYCYSTTGSNQQFIPQKDSTNNCPSGGNSVAFTRERDDMQMAYRLNGTFLEQYVELGSWAQITSNDVVIQTFNIVVSGAIPCNEDSSNVCTGNNNQPVIDLNITGYVNNGLDVNTDFNIQSRIVERRFDTN